MGKTKIEWCDEVWNPVWGCHNNCRYCYARGLASMRGKTDAERAFYPVWKEKNYQHKFARSTKRVFVNSMSDVMYWTTEWIEKTIARMREYPNITFYFLTKGGAYAYNRHELDFPPNAVLGITVTDSTGFEQIDVNALRSTGNKTLINIEPILESVDGCRNVKIATMFDWIIIGAETGNSSKKVIPSYDWYDDIIMEARRNGVPVFIKPSLEHITPPACYLHQYIEVGSE